MGSLGEPGTKLELLAAANLFNFNAFYYEMGKNSKNCKGIISFKTSPIPIISFKEIAPPQEPKSTCRRDLCLMHSYDHAINCYAGHWELLIPCNENCQV